MKSLELTDWETKYLNDFAAFIDEIQCWNPDFIIPVARKACKLMNSVGNRLDLDESILNKIRYLDYFDFQDVNLSEKRIAIVDDVTRRGTTLNDYRNALFSKNCKNENIRAFAFIGHEDLINYECRPDIEVFIFKNRILKNRKYQEYLGLQAKHLLETNFHTDIDHVIIQTDIDNIELSDIEALKNNLTELGFYYELSPIKNIYRFGVHFYGVPNIELVSKRLKLDIRNDFLFKMKFIYNSENGNLTCIPIYFPQLNQNSLSKWKFDPNSFPFDLPMKYISNSSDAISGNIFKNICLLTSILCGRYFYRQIKISNHLLYKKLSKFSIRKFDLNNSVGDEIGNLINQSIKKYIVQDNYESLDNVFNSMKSNDGLFPKEYSSYTNITGMLDFLRKGYAESVRKYELKLANPNERKPYFDSSINELIRKAGNIHPLSFSEIVDEMCDFGIMVPRNRLSEDGFWQRVYRSGECEPDRISWERTKSIIAVLMLTLENETPRIHLEKILANFTFDFPPFKDRNWKGQFDNHCIYTTPHLFGPINQCAHFNYFKDSVYPFQFFNPKHIKNESNRLREEEFASYSDLLEVYKYEYKSRTGTRMDDPSLNNYLPYFSISTNYSPKAINEFIDARFVKDYFYFFKKLIHSSNNVQYVMALSMCRNNELFKYFISFNINNALSNIASIIEELNDPSLSDFNYNGRLRALGLHLDSIHQKLEASSVLLDAWKIANEIANSQSSIIEFGPVWDRITKSMSFEEIKTNAKGVQEFAKCYYSIKDLLKLIELILQLRFPGTAGKRNDIGIEILFNQVNKEHCLTFTFDEVKNVVDSKNDSNLYLFISEISNIVHGNHSEYILVSVKNNFKNSVMSYDLKNYNTSLAIYRRKSETDIIIEQCITHLSHTFKISKQYFVQSANDPKSNKYFFSALNDLYEITFEIIKSDQILIKSCRKIINDDFDGTDYID